MKKPDITVAEFVEALIGWSFLAFVVLGTLYVIIGVLTK